MSSSQGSGSESTMQRATRPDLLTISALAVIATIITSVIHEGVGHGGMCVATGGIPVGLSSVHFQCSAETRLVAAGGTLANLVFGALFWGMMRLAKRSASWRYLLWLLMTFNLLDAGGYFLFSGVGNIGDWAAVVEGMRPPWMWRVGLTVLGGVTYFVVFVPLTLRALRPFVGSDSQIRVCRARLLTVAPYLVCGILSCAAGALNPVGPMLILISAAAASFGGKSGMAWMWTLLRNPRITSSELQMSEIKRSWSWIAGAAILTIGFMTILAPGINFVSTRRG